MKDEKIMKENISDSEVLVILCASLINNMQDFYERLLRDVREFEFAYNAFLWGQNSVSMHCYLYIATVWSWYGIAISCQ